MATFFSRLGSSKYEPLPRFGHVSQTVGSTVLVQGGWTKDFSEKSRQHLTSVVETFDPYSELWEQRHVEGDAPLLGTFAASSVSLHDDLFTFGGTDGRNYFNTLHKLDTKTWRWSQLSPQNAEGAPMPKAGCGMIWFGDNLGMFGGYGKPEGPTEPQTFMKSTMYTDGRGWSNEFHIYHLKEGVFILAWCSEYTCTHTDLLLVCILVYNIHMYISSKYTRKSKIRQARLALCCLQRYIHIHEFT